MNLLDSVQGAVFKRLGMNERLVLTRTFPSDNQPFSQEPSRFCALFPVCLEFFQAAQGFGGWSRACRGFGAFCACEELTWMLTF